MPFTFSHPAILWPFKFIPSQYYSVTALVVGSLSPDFEYFLRMKVESCYSHQLAGVFYFDLPLGLLLCYLFHGLIRKALFQNMPKFIESRSQNLLDFSWHQYAKNNKIVVACSLIVGAFSHIFWDAFTHKGGYFVDLFALNGFAFGLPIFKILQHGSSLLGAILIFYSLFKLPQKPIEQTKMKFKYWVSLLVLSLILLRIRLAFGLSLADYGHIIASMISCVILSMAFLGLWHRLGRKDYLYNQN